MNGFYNFAESAMILLISILTVVIVFLVIAILFRILSKIVIKTYFQEKEKNNGKKHGGNSQREIKK